MPQFRILIRMPAPSLWSVGLRSSEQGRMLTWHPGATETKRRALPAYCPESWRVEDAAPAFLLV